MNIVNGPSRDSIWFWHMGFWPQKLLKYHNLDPHVLAEGSNFLKMRSISAKMSYNQSKNYESDPWGSKPLHIAASPYDSVPKIFRTVSLRDKGQGHKVRHQCIHLQWMCPSILASQLTMEILKRPYVWICKPKKIIFHKTIMLVKHYALLCGTKGSMGQGHKVNYLDANQKPLPTGTRPSFLWRV